MRHQLHFVFQAIIQHFSIFLQHPTAMAFKVNRLMVFAEIQVSFSACKRCSLKYIRVLFPLRLCRQQHCSKICKQMKIPHRSTNEVKMCVCLRSRHHRCLSFGANRGNTAWQCSLERAHPFYCRADG